MCGFVADDRVGIAEVFSNLLGGEEVAFQLVEKNAFQVDFRDFVPAGGADVFGRIAGHIHFGATFAKGETGKQMRHAPGRSLLGRPP